MNESVLSDAAGRADTRDGLFSGNNPFELVTKWLALKRFLPSSQMRIFIRAIRKAAQGLSHHSSPVP